ncbi:helix-turn-helix domain-containing protein [Alteromonas aestuariivivens]|uniref:Helix-turn-helix domain-containing protein n=1 Tax=Alteromonas aestuariivivens TaxID=1938339 RepID=A0A3D8MEE0_9ALTE|nr:helix-turn-helix domain-containing protein [Alteromonas aestuariivivens]RDV29112.1 helix-turn-helix domain-containing protein [Alteromonas aestuariivivens]
MIHQNPKVLILLTESLSIFEYACATELFALQRDEFDHWYTTDTVSLTHSSYEGLAGTQLNCRQVGVLPECDLLVIPSYPVNALQVPDKLLASLRHHHGRGGRTISFCSGAFLLAEAGLLDGRPATTHWRYAEQFKQRFPSIEFRDDILYLYDGQIGCSAGSAAGIDLGIEVIRRDFGYSAANIVARRLVLPAHRSGGQSQYIEKPASNGSTGLAKSLDWAVNNLSHTLRVDDIARQANMTRRTFDRHFKKSFNITPQVWLTHRKLEIAQRLLEDSNLNIEQIALKSGYENGTSLRINFKKYISVSPNAYREQFGRKEPPPF